MKPRQVTSIHVKLERIRVLDEIFNVDYGTPNSHKYDVLLFIQTDGTVKEAAEHFGFDESTIHEWQSRIRKHFNGSHGAFWRIGTHA